MAKPKDIQFRVVFACPECGHENECFVKFKRTRVLISVCAECETFFDDEYWTAVEGPEPVTQEQRERITPPENHSLDEVRAGVEDLEAQAQEGDSDV